MVEASLALSPGAGGRLCGPNLVIPGYRRLFGGQLLGQGLMAACTSASYVPRSLHMVFLAEGRPDEPVEWEVGIVRDGRSFCTRSVDAWQGDRRLATALVSLHVPEDGFSHAAPAPAVARPSSLRAVPPAGALPCEMRVDGDVPLDGGEPGPPALAVWMRLPRPPAIAGDAGGSGGDGGAGGGAEGAGGSALASAAVLAWCSDATMMTAALRPHGVAVGSPALAATSVTSHTVSFHRPFAFEGWMLFAQESPVAAGGRAYVRGDWFDAGDALVASCAQEVLVRRARAPAPA